MPGDQNANYVSAEEGDLYFRSQLLRRRYLNQCFFPKFANFKLQRLFITEGINIPTKLAIKLKLAASLLTKKVIYLEHI